MYSELLGSFDLVAYVNFRRWVVAHQHHRQTGSQPALRQGGNFFGDLVFDRIGDSSTVKDSGRHSWPQLSSVIHCMHSGTWSSQAQGTRRFRTKNLAEPS